MQAELRVPELQAEVLSERDRRQTAEHDARALRGQVTQLREANTQLEGQVKGLKRELTNVKYELETSTPLQSRDPRFRDSLSSLSHHDAASEVS